MESIAVIFDYIGRTNLFNFIIFISIIVYLAKKMDVVGKINNQKDIVVCNIENSKSAKESSEKELRKIEEAVTHIDEQIDEILKTANKNANMVGDKILHDADNIVNSINDNSRKNLDTKSTLIKNDILKRASLASIEVAKNHIIQELSNNYELHNKLIEESINSLDGVKI